MGEVNAVRSYAGFWRRAGAVLLDGLILMVVNGLLSTIFTLGGDRVSLIGQVVTNLLGIIYYVYFIGNRGQTPGKMVLKIRVQKSFLSIKIRLRLFINRQLLIPFFI